MKVKMWNVVDITNTSYQGQLPEGTTFNQIEEVFGKGKRVSVYSKTHVEWQGKINRKVFTIYDYRIGGPVEKNTNWHIGANDKEIAIAVREYFMENCTSVTPAQLVSEISTPTNIPTPTNVKKNLENEMKNNIEQFEMLFEQYKNRVTYHEYEKVKKLDETFAQMRFAFHQI